MIKSELRQIYLRRQRSMINVERIELSEQIASQFFRSFDLSGIKCLHIFLPIERNAEVETRFIYEKVWRNFPGIKTVVPFVNSKIDEIEAVEFDSKSELSLSNWQIPEPKELIRIDPKLIDIVIVPLLAIDISGYRVGYGKGFYDKFLAKCRMDCLKIGVSFFDMIGEITDKDKFDVKLNYCLTPNRTVKFKKI